MTTPVHISGNLAVGAQVSQEDIDRLKREGYRTIVNFREAGERDQALSPDEEGERVRAAGLNYVHLPVSGSSPSPQQVQRYRDELQRAPGPVYAHCHLGTRAGAFALIGKGIEQGWTGEQLLEQARKLGFQSEKPIFQRFAREYVDQAREQSTAKR